MQDIIFDLLSVGRFRQLHPEVDIIFHLISLPEMLTSDFNCMVHSLDNLRITAIEMMK